MATTLTTTELRTMQIQDLRKEIAEKRLVVAKMHIEIQMRSEKDTARFLREKKELARLLTIAREKESAEPAKTPARRSSESSKGQALKTAKKPAKVPASSAS